MLCPRGEKMRDCKKEYEICKQACINAGCAIPEECTFHMRVANTLEYIRVYFHAKGFEDGVSENVQIANKVGCGKEYYDKELGSQMYCGERAELTLCDDCSQTLKKANLGGKE